MRIITERTEMAKLMNFGKYPVLSVNLDNKPFKDIDENSEYTEGCECRVSWGESSGRFKGMSTLCTLCVEKGEYSLTTGGSCLKGSYNVDDFIEDINKANTPLINASQEVVIAHYSKSMNISFVKIMRVGSRIDRNCMTVVKLEEMD